MCNKYKNLIKNDLDDEELNKKSENRLYLQYLIFYNLNELKNENDWLNNGEGWELVNVIKDKSDIPSKHKMIYYFKREKIS